MMQKNNVLIVPLQKKHIPDMAQLERECFSSPWSEEMIEEEFSNKCAVYVAAECDGEFCGYAGLHKILDEGYITNVAVASGFRRCGIARKLIETLIGSLPDLSFVTLEVRVSNHPAIELYKSLGFCEAGVRKNYYTKPCEDAYLMTKLLCETETEDK